MFKSRGHTGAPSYSLFPTEGSSPSKVHQPTSVYDISDLAPPPIIHFTDGPRHRRDSSIASSATVQIGLRISHAPASAREDMNGMSLPSTTYKFSPKAPASTLPSIAYTTAPAPLPSTTYTRGSNPFLPAAARTPPSPSPLKIQTNVHVTPQAITTIPIPPPSLPRPTNLSNTLSNTLKKPPSSSPTQSLINKRLPPTPRESLPKFDTAHPPQLVRQSTTQLTPAVYSPEQKIKTSELVELRRAPMSANLPNSVISGRGDLASPMSPPTRSMSGRNPTSQQQAKGEWI